MAALAYFALKYREKKKFAAPDEMHGSVLLEIVWSGIPFVLAMTIFVFGDLAFFTTTTLSPPTRWRCMWSGNNGCGSSSTLPGSARSTSCTFRSGRKVKLTMTTEDVLHDFYIPAFRTKADVVPGRYTYIWFEATKPGKYQALLRRILRPEPFRNGRLGLCDGAARFR